MLTVLAWADLVWLADDMSMGGINMTGFRMIPSGQSLMMPANLTGWPVFAHSSPLGCAVGSGSTVMCRVAGIYAERFLPSIR